MGIFNDPQRLAEDVELASIQEAKTNWLNLASSHPFLPTANLLYFLMPTLH